MTADIADTIAQLKREILPMPGYRPLANGTALDLGIGPIAKAFPNHTFPVGAVHEFICPNREDVSATIGFIAGVLKTLMQKDGAAIWITSSRNIYPPALKLFGINPANIIFIDLQKEKDVLWTMEEALKCEGLAAVIAETKELGFMASRRLQLAVEKSRVTGFIVRCYPKYLTTTACVTRWKITSVPGELPGDIPGVGFPRWNIELLKVRNGKPGAWEIEWNAETFKPIFKADTVYQELKKKTG
jgi:protein ImuA